MFQIQNGLLQENYLHAVGDEGNYGFHAFKPCRLTCTITNGEIIEFESFTAAANYLKASKPNISRAAKKKIEG